MTNLPIWSPSQARLDNANVTAYRQWLASERGLEFADYQSLWRWSIEEIEAFWGSLWDYFEIVHAGSHTAVLRKQVMPGAQWFEGAKVNYVAQILANAQSEFPAIVSQTEGDASLTQTSWRELEQRSAALAATLTELGVGVGDRVVAYIQNIPEAVIAFHATASIGAVWSVCAPDLGEQGVLDRFAQIAPKVLIASDGYLYGGKQFARAETLAKLVAGLPSLSAVIAVPILGDGNTGLISQAHAGQCTLRGWAEASAGNAKLAPVMLAFDHPLWIVYSSGTTGKPKAIVHSHGGIVLEHCKQVSFHLDLKAGERFFWQTSTAWMMWNFQIAGLFAGATICLFDGSPGKPDLYRLWQFVDEANVVCFGAGAAFFETCKKAQILPREQFALKHLQSMGATGSPLLPDVYEWIYSAVGDDIYLSSISGGTDFCTAIVGGVPVLDVYIGEIACSCLGAAVAAFNDQGEAVIDEVGELVLTKPLPSMPIYFWNDEGGELYHESYFATFPGIWQHGDWIRITPRGGSVIYGRSDSTINRQGIRMGTSELYQVVEAMPEIMDSLVVDLEYLGRDSYLPLFIVLREGQALDASLRERINHAIRDALSPRHVPNDIFVVDEIPRTFSGKKLEIPVRRLLLGQPPEKSVNKNTMANPQSIDWFIKFAKTLTADG